MKVKTKKVYYCDYCKKHSLRSLVEHEKHCTMNPDRECRLDNCPGYELPYLIEKYKKQLVTKIGALGFVDVVEMPDIKDIKDDVSNCPNCTFTILRCAKLLGSYKGDRFDYKAELESWWADINEYQRREDEQSAMYGM